MGGLGAPRPIIGLVLPAPCMLVTSVYIGIPGSKQGVAVMIFACMNGCVWHKMDGGVLFAMFRSCRPFNLPYLYFMYTSAANNNGCVTGCGRDTNIS